MRNLSRAAIGAVMAAVLTLGVMTSTALPAHGLVRTCTSATPVSLRPTLRYGDTGSCVTVAQTLLLGRGYTLGGYNATGTFATYTLRAAKLFQSDRYLMADGVIGPLTWAALTTNPPSTTSRTDSRTGSQLDKPFVVDDIAVISRNHPVTSAFKPLPASAVPYGLIPRAQTAYDQMVAAARSAGVTLRMNNAYRDYATQKAIYERALVTYPSPELAMLEVAPPGRSEHQLGSTVDFTDAAGTTGAAFASTAAGRWLWANAHRFGFILRYPPDKVAIVGYTYEPWHYRHIGTGPAARFGPNHTLTLEEYLQIR